MANQHKILIFGIGIVISVLLLGIGYAVAELFGLVIAGIIIVLIFSAYSYFTTNYITLNEMEVGVLFSRKGNFVCFLDNEYGRIYPRKSEHDKPRKLLNPVTRHKINPAIEVFSRDNILRKGTFDCSGTCNDIRTREGIPINIPWKLSFRIEVLRIFPGIEYKLARALPKNADKMLAGRMPQILQHVVGKKSVEEIYATQDQDGSAIKRLEDEIRSEILSRTGGIGVTGIAQHDFKIGPIQLPAEIDRALRTAYKRTLHTKMMAKALNTLRQEISAFTEEDMDRITELERLRIIDEKTKSMTFNESFISSRKEKNVRFFDEEKSQENGNGNHQE